MMRTHGIPALCLLATISVVGCSKGEDTPSSGSGAAKSESAKADAKAETVKMVKASPDGMFKAFESARTGSPEAVWNTLPASYQADVTALLGDFATKMDPVLWEKGFATASTVVKVVDEKREFILGFPLIAMFTAQTDKAELNQHIDTLVKTLRAVVESDVKSLETLKELDVEKFLASSLGGTIKDIIAASETVGTTMGEPGSPLTDKFATRVVSEDGDSALVEITVEGKAPEQVEMARVDGHWLPKEMVEGWKEGFVEARESLKTMEITPEDKAQAIGMFGMVDGLLQQLLATKTQDEFNEAIQGIEQTFGSMMGG